MLGPLVENPRRVGHELRGELEGRWAARRGPYRIVDELDEQARQVRVLRIDSPYDLSFGAGRGCGLSWIGGSTGGSRAMPLIGEVHGWKRVLVFVAVVILGIVVASILWALGIRDVSF